MRRPSPPSPKVRHLWWIPGLAIAVAANQLTGIHGHGLVPILAFGIVPHLPVLLGRGRPHAAGQLPPRVVPLVEPRVRAVRPPHRRRKPLTPLGHECRV